MAVESRVFLKRVDLPDDMVQGSVDYDLICSHVYSDCEVQIHFVCDQIDFENVVLFC